MRPEQLGIDRRRSEPVSGKKAHDLKDIAPVLARAVCKPDGSYRASRATPGRSGSFKYYGTRPDDPNDVIPHEHRRDFALYTCWRLTNLWI